MIIIDNFISDPIGHTNDILSKEFYDVQVGDQLFKGIQTIGSDQFSSRLLIEFPGYNVAYNFARLSPEGQDEPNFIHTDEMMGDVTAILYLTKNPLLSDGTTLYENDNTPSVVVGAKFNRAFIFDSQILHSRNIFENYGSGIDARLIQVIFLKKI